MSDNGPINAFEELVKRGATPSEVARLKKIKDSLGFDDNDAIWAIFLGLEYYLTLYSAQSDSLEKRVYNSVRDALPKGDQNHIEPSKSSSPGLSKIALLGLLAGSTAALGFFGTNQLLALFL